MRCLFAVTAAMVLLGCGSAAAQTGVFGAPPAPGMGVVSPLGAIVTTAPIGGAGLELGSTELYPGGLSPAPGDPTLGATVTGPDVSAGLSSVPGSGAVTAATVTSLGSGVIQLGATDSSTAGLSPAFVVPVPSAPAAPCTSIGVAPNAGASVLTAPNGSFGGVSMPFGC
jgi:hypothetical protein